MQAQFNQMQAKMFEAHFQHQMELSFLQGQNKALRHASATDAASASRSSGDDADNFETLRIAHEPPDAEKHGVVQQSSSVR